ncbi:hypothetical protein [Flavobacterium litorale]|uniref:Lipoprotein n=1 Tax=Flavobacterium litorale TaxID=2856519 RepID=A0ABX8VDI7_9FLAO|nr:hypothetical protein [Flavobacterium litorale]QYJ68905.1 hypothetical protein K1I41_03205 [Flavobacterium litorale]
MKKITMCLFAVLAIVFASCSDDENKQSAQESTELTDEGITNALVEGVKALRIDFTQPTTFNYTTEIERDSIIGTITVEIFEGELNSYRNEQGQLISDEIAANILINEREKTIIVQPEPLLGVVIYSNPEDDDNKKCGGKAGDGWKSYGICYTDSCAENKSKEAAADLRKTLRSGQCLDIRIKRNATNARVCARVVSC